MGLKASEPCSYPRLIALRILQLVRVSFFFVSAPYLQTLRRWFATLKGIYLIAHNSSYDLLLVIAGIPAYFMNHVWLWLVMSKTSPICLMQKHLTQTLPEISFNGRPKPRSRFSWLRLPVLCPKDHSVLPMNCILGGYVSAWTIYSQRMSVNGLVV